MLRDERVDVEATWAVDEGVSRGGDAANEQTDRDEDEVTACEQLPRSPGLATPSAADAPKRREGSATTSYGDVVMRTEAKVALRQLGYKAAAAKEAVDRAWAALEQPADVAAIVSKALQLDRAVMEAGGDVSPDGTERLAYKALVQSGFSTAVARRAVDAALRVVGPDAELAVLVAEAFRQCGGA